MVNECCEFIKEAFDQSNSVLIHSVKGKNRASVVLTAWIMRRYQWSLAKTLEFLSSRRLNLELRPAFLNQLNDYESKLKERGLGSKTCTWNEICETTNKFENEELLLRNTYLNAKPSSDCVVVSTNRSKGKLKWIDYFNECLPLSTVIGEEMGSNVKEEFTTTGSNSSRNYKKSLKGFASDPVKIHKGLFGFKERKSSRKYTIKPRSIPRTEPNNTDNNNPPHDKIKKIIKMEMNLLQKKNISLIERIVQNRVKKINKKKVNTLPDSPLERNTVPNYFTLKPKLQENELDILKPLADNNTDLQKQDSSLTRSKHKVQKKPFVSIIKKVEPKKVDSVIRPSSVGIRCGSMKRSLM